MKWKLVMKRVLSALVVLALVAVVGLLALLYVLFPDMEPSTINHYASFCTTDRVRHELEHGANPNSGDRYSGSSALFTAAGGVNTSNPDECVNTVGLLIAAGGDVDRREGGKSLLAKASAGDATPALIDLLVEHGADVCAPISEHLPERIELGGMPARHLLSVDFDWLSEYALRRERPEMSERLEHHEKMCPAHRDHG